MLKELAEEKEEFTARATGIIKKELQNFMKQHPNIEALGWVQYAPHFNDGDACIFSFYGLNVKVKNLPSKNEYEDDYYSSSYFVGKNWFEVYRSEAPKESGLMDIEWDELCDLNRQLQALTSELQAVFGDDCKVTVTRQGVEIEEYEHE